MSVPLRNGNDTYVAESTPSKNYSNSTQIVVKAGAGSQFYSYLYFVRPFPLGATILSATLKLYQISPETATHTVTAKVLTQPWYQSQTTWNQKPTSTTTGQVSVTKAFATPIGTEWAFDVTAVMQSVSDGLIWRGWQIITNLDDFLYLGSTQHATYKPVLEIEWSDVPDAPTTLSPSGNRAVSVAKPVLRFDFTDVSGDTSLTGVQVQINATDVWTAPSFDSGTVLTSVPELDLNTTAYAGLPVAASTYWRVRVQDGAGLWSDWSAGAQFQRQSKGTLTITNPPVSGLISEPTPPITWTFTGTTQAAWQIFITPTAQSSTILYNTGKVSGTAVSHTLPAGILVDDSSYTLTLRVWDTISRESTPGDTAWVEASRDFTYDYDATVNPVTSLVATDLAPAPGVTLTWDRATAPDSFLVRRDGVIIAADLLPGDLLVSGTTYTYTDRGADPHKAITWSVDAVVNGKTSADSPTVTMTLDTVGIWLQYPDQDIAVMLRGADPGTWAMGEAASNYAPVSGTRVLRVTQGLRGFEGSITGTIRTDDTGTVEEYEQDLYTIKARPGWAYLLTLSNITIPAVIGNMVIAPTDNRGYKTVSFDFWQSHDLPFSAIL